MNVFLTKCRLSLSFMVFTTLTVLIIALPSSMFAAGRLQASTDDYFIHYEQDTNNKLAVGIRTAGEASAVSATLEVADAAAIPSSTLIPYPRDGDKTALLFLVDVSKDKTRKKVIKKNSQQIQTLLQAAKAHQQLGLATFGEKFTVLAPIGTEQTAISTAVNGIAANENETLLYQYTGQAIELLAKQAVARRVLIIFSDGKTEDQTAVYNHQSMLDKAKQHDIIIVGLAFPPKPTAGHQVRDYQTLSSLATDTGGLFIKAAADGDVSQADLLKVMTAGDKGGYWAFDLSTLSTSVTGETPATLQLKLSDQQAPVTLPITLNLTDNTLVGLSRQQQIIAIVSVILLLFGGLIYLLKRSRPEPVITYAYIDSLDGNERYDINKKTYKIGRNPENDLALANPTVSSFHAQIHLTRDEEFMITDLQSINGILINDVEETIASAALEDGDLITIGEVRLRFVAQ